MKWFAHHAAASADSKLKKVLIKYGASGYGLYWYCIENICKNVGSKLTFELEHDSEILAHELKLDTLLVEEMMLYMINIKLFESSDGMITCIKLAKYIEGTGTRNQELKQIIKNQKEALSQTVPDSTGQSGTVPATLHNITLHDITKDKPSVSSPKNTPVPISKIVDLYHELLPTLPSVQKLTSAREGAIRQRWREDMQTLDQWENFFTYISTSDFLMGRVQPRDGKRPFLASLEWVCKASNFTKILEGNYHGV